MPPAGSGENGAKRAAQRSAMGLARTWATCGDKKLEGEVVEAAVPGPVVMGRGHVDQSVYTTTIDAGGIAMRSCSPPQALAPRV